MAAFHTQMKAQKLRPISELADKLKANPNFDYCSKTEQIIDRTSVILIVFEQYFYRASGTISLSVLLTEYGGYQTADLIASGGGEGWSWSGGACRSFVNEAAAILRESGFSDLNPCPEESLPQKILNYFFD